jgi:hypothetical protein
MTDVFIKRTGAQKSDDVKTHKKMMTVFTPRNSKDCWQAQKLEEPRWTSP